MNALILCTNRVGGTSLEPRGMPALGQVTSLPQGRGQGPPGAGGRIPLLQNGAWQGLRSALPWSQAHVPN